MEKLRILMACMVLLAGLSAETRAEDNPFDKGVDVNIGRDQAWLIKDKAVTRSGADSDNFYHLSYNLKQLRLRITSGAEDSEASARQYQQFAVEDMQIDGQQLPLFQWCLTNQARHSRFLQQGLKVKQDVCSNIGEQGTFIMKLNAATLDALEKGRTLSIKIKPFRSSINLNFDISDFSEVAASLNDKVVVQKAPAPVAAPVSVPVPVVAEKKVMPAKTCKAAAPKDFAKIKPVEYVCDDAAAKTAAEASIAVVVAKERELAAKLAADNERKQKEAAEAKKAKELADKKLQEERLAIEQLEMAEAEASKLEINNEITNKMLAICMKKWEKGESRCYCEKFLEHAPAGIVADPACAASE